MPLKALYQFKVNELFLQWISQSETQDFLLMNLQYISNDSVPTPSQRRPYRKFLKKIAEKNRPSNKTKKKKIKKSDKKENEETHPKVINQTSDAEPQPNSTNYRLNNDKIMGTHTIQKQQDQKSSQLTNDSMQLQYNSLELEIMGIFKENKNKIYFMKFHKILNVCQLPIYLRKPIFECITGNTKSDSIFLEDFIGFWRRLEPYHGEKDRLVFKILSDDRDYIKEEFLKFIIQDVVDTHPKLQHLKISPDFHEIYTQTVLERIFMGVTKTWRKIITFPEAKAAKFFKEIENLDTTLPSYFDYKDFYVIYCTFRELDRDGDNFLRESDIMSYDDGGLSSKVVKEIFKKKNLMNSASGRMNYSDFVRFIMAEEGKNERISIEYWFRCLDIEGNGILTYSVLKEFYNALMEKNEFMIGDQRDFKDIYWQCFDMIRPQNGEGFRLSDLKKSNLAKNFINTFVNFNKFMTQEESFSTEYPYKTPWNVFVECRYNQLAQETMQVTDYHFNDTANASW